MESAMPQVITQLKIVSWLYIICSIVVFFILVILFMQGRLYFYFNNASCAMKCFTNPLEQAISDIVELHKEYKTSQENYIILQQNYAQQTKQLEDMKKQKNDLDIELGKTVTHRDVYKQKLDSYKIYLDFIGSIDVRIRNMDMCNSFLKLHCDCLKDDKEDPGCAIRYYKHLNCENALSQDHHDKIKTSYTSLLANVIMVKKNLTELLITGNFAMMQEIYEQKKDLPMDNCHFICSLDVENKVNASYWQQFSEGWKLFSKYFISNLTS